MLNCDQCSLTFLHDQELKEHVQTQHLKIKVELDTDQPEYVQETQMGAVKVKVEVDVDQDPLNVDQPVPADITDDPEADDGETSSSSIHCKLCNQVFENTSAKLQHFKEKHFVKVRPPTSNHKTVRKFECETCLSSFQKFCELKSHYQMTGHQLQFKCEKCQQIFHKRMFLVAHERKCIKREPGTLQPEKSSPLVQLSYCCKSCPSCHLQSPAAQLPDCLDCKFRYVYGNYTVGNIVNFWLITKSRFYTFGPKKLIF